MKFTKIELFSAAAILAVFVTAFVKPQIFSRDLQPSLSTASLENEVFPPNGVEIPAKWNDLGSKLVDTGVIDKNKFEVIYSQRGGLTAEEKRILYGANNGNIKITPGNTGFWLNLFWALGLGNKNKILENGPITDLRYGSADNFASTGGWTLAKGNTMDHYLRHEFVKLTSEQQKLVEEVSKNIYRPCCNNPTYFPDCNHGMAMLGLLELMASQGIPENNIYKIALQTNSYWFSDIYLTIARYLKEKKNISWGNVNPKEILGYNYSSASGYQNILNQITPPVTQSGGGCGI